MTNIICFEGQDGVGKTTQVMKLEGYLYSLGYEVKSLKSPGQTPLGKELRKLLLTPEPGKETQGYGAVGLFLADMIDCYHKEILPLLGKEKVVILLDRFWYSTWCYQTSEGVSKRILLDLFRDALPIKPDLKILLQLPLDESLKRSKERGPSDFIESRPIEYHRQVLSNYEELALLEQFHTIPVSTVEATHQKVVKLCDEFIHSHKPSKTPPLMV